MPIYEFECVKCKIRFENIQKIVDPSPDCVCGGETKKMVSKTTFRLKGKGWYKDGYTK